MFEKFAAHLLEPHLNAVQGNDRPDVFFDNCIGAIGLDLPIENLQPGLPLYIADDSRSVVVVVRNNPLLTLVA